MKIENWDRFPECSKCGGTDIEKRYVELEEVDVKVNEAVTEARVVAPEHLHLMCKDCKFFWDMGVKVEST